MARYARVLQRGPMRSFSSPAAEGEPSRPGPGTNPRKILAKAKCNACGRKPLERPDPSSGSPSKCLEPDYGKRLKTKRPWFNFCKLPVHKKEKPCAPPKLAIACKEQSFWDYLFNFESKPKPDPCTCRLTYNQKQKCKPDDPRLRDSRFTPTKGDVLIFTEYSKPETCTSAEPQPRPPPSYRPPKAVTCKHIADSASLPAYMCDLCPPKSDLKSCGPKPYRPPYDEFRPVRIRRKRFTCADGMSSHEVGLPYNKEKPAGGRSFAEYQAEATLPSKKGAQPSPCLLLNEACNPHATIKKSSRYQQLQKLTRAAAGNRCAIQTPEELPHPGPSPSCCKPSCKISTSAVALNTLRLH